MCQITLPKSAEKVYFFLTTVTTVTVVTTVIFFIIYFLSTFELSNLTDLTTDVMFSGQRFAILAMFTYSSPDSILLHVQSPGILAL